ncbi:maintenance of telomere capping protein 1 [Schizophyllum fasciatum]
MTTKSKSKQEEALAFLDDLDNIAPPPPEAATNAGAPAAAAAAPKPGEGEAEFLAFIDEITQKSAEPVPQVKTRSPAATLSRSGTPTVRKSTERFKLSSQGRATPPAPAASTSDKAAASSESAAGPAEAAPSEGGGGWGWGSWNTGSVWNALQQARDAVEEQAKNLPQNEQARKWGEGVIAYAKKADLPVDINKLGADFKRVGLSTLTDILNVVAPPISEHEVIRVWLSHDLRGYDGIQSLVYQALTRVLEQVKGGDLIVNSGKEIRPKDPTPDEEDVRDLAIVDGYEAALRLSQANLEELVKLSASAQTTTQSNITIPTTYSDVYLRIQAYTATRHLPSQITTPASQASSAAPPVHQDIHFLLYLSDPSHSLTHTTVTQAVPLDWIDLWNDNAEKYEWVEDVMAEALRIGVEVLGQGYVVERMGWMDKDDQAPEDADHAQQSSEASEDAVKVDKEDAN